MHRLYEILINIDKYIGSADWFVYLLLGTGIFFTIYLGFPQFRYFRHAIRIVRGKYSRKGDKGDTTHFQALTTALSGTVGTGNIAGVALAIHMGGPAALFWMMITALFGMTLKFAEVTMSHKYREFDSKGNVAGGPMYVMKKRLNINLGNGKMLKTGVILGGLFAIFTIFSSFGTGNLPQINSISDSLFATFKINPVITGAVLSIVLGFIIIGGITRIAKVTEKLVPFMAIIYLLGAFIVLIYNYQNILPSIGSVFSHVFSGTAAIGGFLGASMKFAFNRGVNRGLFSNEAGQGSAPIAHASAKAHEPVSEGMVALLEPFIDTIVICFITGITILSSGVWKDRYENKFQFTDIEILEGIYGDKNAKQKIILTRHINNEIAIESFDGVLQVENGEIENDITIIHSRSLAKNVLILNNKNELYSGEIQVNKGKINEPESGFYLYGKSLLKNASLTTKAFTKGFLGKWGQYIVSVGLLLFAFSTAISWSYYGDRAVTYLAGNKFISVYRIIYVISFFLASFTDTTIIWAITYITVSLMTIPNLISILLLHKEIKTEIKKYWIDFKNVNY